MSDNERANNMKEIVGVRLLTSVAFAVVVAGCSTLGYMMVPDMGTSDAAQGDIQISEDRIRDALRAPLRQTLSGSYLAGRHAQVHHDWSAAREYIDLVRKNDPDNLLLKRRALILSLGAQEFEEAFKLSEELLAEPEDKSFASVILSLKYIKEEKFAKAVELLNIENSHEMTGLIAPVFKEWARAGLGASGGTDSALSQDPSYRYHSVLIAEYIGDEDKTRALVETFIDDEKTSLFDVQRIAEIQIAQGRYDLALRLYQMIDIQRPGLAFVDMRIKELQGDPKKIVIDTKVTKANSVAQGAGASLKDIAQILYQKYSDESTRMFASMGIYLDPGSQELRNILAAVSVRNGRLDDAITHYEKIITEEKPDAYISSQKLIAGLLKEKGNLSDAMQILTELVETHDNFEAQVLIGDYYRSEENFRDALIAYNKGFEMIGDDAEALKENWHLYYSRGIAHERLGQWTEGEADLQQALTYQPDHPYVLNYLGYSWADREENLDKALEMIAKAVRLQPDDGFIADSLGWVYYRMDAFQDSLPHLERAVELEPYNPTLNDHLGDAYWQVGRRNEARFQWRRALNYADIDIDKDVVTHKLKHGLNSQVVVSHEQPVEKRKDSVRKGSPLND